MDERIPTTEALASARSLLSSIDHAGRRRLDAEARLSLVVEVVALGRQVEALRAVLVGEADRAKAAERARGTSIKTLLATSARVTVGEAAGWVFAGQEVNHRAGVRAAALSGDLSVAQARAIDKVLGELPSRLTDGQRERAEQIMLNRAQSFDAKGLAGQTRAVLEEVAPELDAVEDEASRLETERRQAWAARSLTITPDGRGSMLIRGQLPVLEGEAFKKLVDGYTRSNRRALEAAADHQGAGAIRTHEQRCAEGLIALTQAHTTNTPGSSGRPAAATVLVTMSLDSLQAHQEQAGALADGKHLSPGELRRVLCDCDIIPAVLGSASEPLDIGRLHRLVTPRLRRALELRDGGCAFPGCQVPAHASEAHHITPWWNGGRTGLENLVLLCPHHHGTVEPLRFWSGPPPTRWAVSMGHDGHARFQPPRRPGQVEPPPPVRHQRIVAKIEQAQRAHAPALA